MKDAMSARRLDLWSLFLKTHARVVEQLATAMQAEQALPLAWFDVMLHLSFAPGESLRMHELLRSLVLTRSGLTRRIDRMEAAGLVRREGCADDARGVVVVLTEDGQSRLRDAIPRHLTRVQQRFTCHFTDDEVNMMCNALSKVLKGDFEVRA